MGKRNNDILVNYESEPFYNAKQDAWLIDFGPEIKQELKSLLRDSYFGLDICKILAIPNITIDIIRVFKELDDSTDFIALNHIFQGADRHTLYKKADMEFLCYRLAQLMTKHPVASFEDKRNNTFIAVEFMQHGGIDLINELGDIYNYPSHELNQMWGCFWHGNKTNFFKINKIFKSKFMREFAYNFVARLRGFDECIE